MTQSVLGIDLGTSNSVAVVALDGETAVVPDEHGHRVHPSIVYFDEQGRTRLGHDAIEPGVADPAHLVYSAKRLIGRAFSDPQIESIAASLPFPVVAARDGGVRLQIRDLLHPPEGIGARLLYHLRALAEAYVGFAVRQAVITVPANFDEGQRRATQRAAEMAGLEVLRLLNEPTAAALAYGRGSAERETVAVYDFGGGTFDVTLLSLRDEVFEVLSTAGNSYLGGDDIDERLAQAIFAAIEAEHGLDLSDDHGARRRIKEAARRVKHELTTAQQTAARLIEYDPQTGAPLTLDFSLERAELERRSADIVEASLATCREALDLAGLKPSSIDRLVLVGGTTRMPIVRQRVAALFGRDPVFGINPDEVVAVGAALYGSSLLAPPASAPEPIEWDEGGEEWLEAIDEPARPPAIPGPAPGAPRRPLLVDVTPHALGIATVGGVMDVIIERNAQLPLERVRHFSPARDNQERVELPIYAGTSRRIEENRALGTLALEEIPPGPREEVTIEVSFEVNTDSMLNVRATDLRTGLGTAVALSIAGELGQSEAEEFAPDEWGGEPSALEP